MTKLQEEIEYAHNNRSKKILLRDVNFMFDVVCLATNTYTNLSLFWNDYKNSKELGYSERISAYNDLYLLALLHTSEDDFEQVKNKYGKKG